MNESPKKVRYLFLRIKEDVLFSIDLLENPSVYLHIALFKKSVKTKTTTHVSERQNESRPLQKNKRDFNENTVYLLLWIYDSVLITVEQKQRLVFVNPTCMCSIYYVRDLYEVSEHAWNRTEIYGIYHECDDDDARRVFPVPSSSLCETCFTGKELSGWMEVTI